MGMKVPREGLKQFRDNGVTVFLLALRGFARYPPFTCRTKSPQWDEIAGKAKRESKKRVEFRAKDEVCAEPAVYAGRDGYVDKSDLFRPEGPRSLGDAGFQEIKRVLEE